MEAYSIPRSMWESLEAVLHAKGQQLAKEIAKELNVQPQPLLAHLKTMELGKFTLLPDTDDTLYQCEALCPHGAVLLRCKKPVLDQAPCLCSEHKGFVPANHSALRPVQRLILHGEAYILDGSSILTLAGAVCGIKKGTQFILFEECCELASDANL